MAKNEKAIVRYTLNGSYNRKSFDDIKNAINLYKKLNKNPQVHNLSIIY